MLSPICKFRHRTQSFWQRHCFSMKDEEALHVAVFPWLATGHLIPFFELSKHLVQKGHSVSFISTPKNLRRLQEISKSSSPRIHSINFVTLDLPKMPGLPLAAESSADIHHSQSQLLKKAFDLLQTPLTIVLQTSTPDWIIYDYASHWLPPMAADLGISCAFFSLFNAAVLSFLGPLDNDLRTKAEDFTVVPDWIPFKSEVVFRLHEMSKNMESMSENESGTSDIIRFRVAVKQSDVTAIRSCIEFEPEWFNLLHELYRKPVVPVGFLPPSDGEMEDDKKWVILKNWLDGHDSGSVVYVAFGTEARPSEEEITELTLGLEQSELPFLLVLKRESEKQLPPDGFEVRRKERGLVYEGWVPQVNILGHESIGGFLTHCGWNSIVEGLSFGRVLILLPLLNEQGLNARLMNAKGVGVEITREEQGGSFTRDSVADSVRLAMVEEEGESFRASARKMRGLFGDKNRNDSYFDGFVQYLEVNKKQVRR